MTKRLKNIFNIAKSSKIIFFAVFATMFCLLFIPFEANAKKECKIREEPERFGKACEAGNLPILTGDANCSGADCKQEKCLDPAPANPIKRVSSDFGPRKDPTGKRLSLIHI